jgi:hypothetical protein
VIAPACRLPGVGRSASPASASASRRIGSLWSHPTEVRTALRDGGWDADAIAGAFGETVGAELESYGITLPPLPDPDTPQAQEHRT